MKIVAVTSCPSGVAHTYMSAESLELSAKKFGIEIKVETQGSSGIDNELSIKEIEEATCVILTNDVEIRNMERFKGKKVVRMSVSDIIKKSDALIKKIKDTFQ
ncbi:PTS fructose-like transporter subunit IIB [Clostridioides difficile]|uniref:PTS fructose-like transporter subunit IIB n=1 Tax=unclassified Clostridioides TaxID=2635829 RepID=UPI001D0BFFB0|nr:PTS fructose-like transporter subunit IIB [Clostridioides sp. ES-S-0001-02]MCC0641136.1 PTS fructose-like transporter subunit IIB [Clostridioides sp. ES-S-0049-03]MCC0654178.1 PTS fructose-like transporter subunit IIB [Clostridioides sp. ES-S-0001-03]MCC0657928.1 PTS fructose-like transporter subunit IIB [Clostridioides sp. ES-S-0123-01]MCC0674187.1 PTS fructose-like transporter subunit IIB [Clostridioides sp. ES-S-0145-01]MCC0677185.1 PTS fructose-like transporter subunit IIB [Clostridioid